MKAKFLNPILWFFFALLAIGIGLYPVAYFVTDMSEGLFSNKTAELLNDQFWNSCFYIHISFGGLALLIGWLQFSKWLRKNYTDLHRKIGYTYAVSVLLSGVSGLYIACFATGGFMAKAGFFMLAILWLWTTSMAIKAIRHKKIESHQYWMMRSYALTFAAVTLRLWIPFFMAGLHWQFVDAYRIIAWLAWVPNLILIELYICKIST